MNNVILLKTYFRKVDVFIYNNTFYIRKLQQKYLFICKNTKFT